ncbi:MAG TPA: periplasmic heavy metal sensor [Terricaulis sp.]|nr:periplasmic heavy metal sensor [Terricaulis sp.]
MAFVAGVGGVWVGMAGMHAFHHGRPGLHDVVHQRLDLTEDQTTRIEAIEGEFATRRRALEIEMQAANIELAAAIREEHGYGPRVTAAIERFHHAMGELQSETIRHVFAMREVLTPEQQAIFDTTVVDALTAEQQ